LLIRTMQRWKYYHATRTTFSSVPVHNNDLKYKDKEAAK